MTNSNNLSLTITRIVLALSLLTPSLRATEMRYEIENQPDELIIAVHFRNGELNIVTHDKDEIILEGEDVKSDHDPVKARRDGLISIRHLAVRQALKGIKISETDNIIHLERPFQADEDIRITIPARASLIVDQHLNGDITIDGVSGSLEIKTIDGDTDLLNISGPVVINSIDGDIKLVFADSEIPGNSILTSVDGDIDIYVEEDTGLYLSLKTMEGDILSDMDIEVITYKDLKEATSLTDERRKPHKFSGHYKEQWSEEPEASEEAQEAELVELQRERDREKREIADQQYDHRMPGVDFDIDGRSISIPDIPLPPIPDMKSGPYSGSFDRIVIYARINEGGPLITATTIDGDITIRKKKN